MAPRLVFALAFLAASAQAYVQPAPSARAQRHAAAAGAVRAPA
eukprot:CAMPEP_0204600160 /NCGR_PEP_ID=MMETSP0661-20131031/55280_1 /ASSEMBLY_ACC=CAM_ASM_000606 /TAXON_ID=109239 /ORGANISM="Alexandrium margalefi, Strain AMGDE01CS-322" /LENGTH=42 /DNA_ID= /DNA_START= /DNA_END= /DNA_ORIENTATION=